MNINLPLSVLTSFICTSEIIRSYLDEEEVYGEKDSRKVVFLENGQFGIAVFKNPKEANEMKNLIATCNANIREKDQDTFNWIGNKSPEVHYYAPTSFFRDISLF